jgi:hypothetical protein
VLHNRKPQKIFRGERNFRASQQKTPKNFQRRDRKFRLFKQKIPKSKEQREKREQREERENISEEMRGEREIFRVSTMGSDQKNIDILIFTKCTVAFQK